MTEKEALAGKPGVARRQLGRLARRGGAEMFAPPHWSLRMVVFAYKRSLIGREIMKRLGWASIGLAVGVALMAAGSAAAQGGRQIVRGVVAAVTPASLTVTTKDGKAVTVALAPGWIVAVTKPISADAIVPGSFIGTTELPQADGTGVSVEVHVFPPGLKVGEGHYPWDTQPGATMTNGTVGTVAAVGGGRALDVSYPSGTRHVVVPAGVPIVQITPGGAQSLIHPGVSVFLIAVPGPDGAPVTNNVLTGEGGAAPPM